MKKIVLILALLCFCSVVHAEDRVNVQVMFKKFVWTCPTCQAEDIVDANVGGDNTYTHTCVNGHSFNQSGSNMREYNGCLSYTPTEYENETAEGKASKKAERVNQFIYDYKNPPVYVDPSAEDYVNMINDHMAQVEELGAKLKAKTTQDKINEVGDGVIEKGQKIKE